MDITDAIREIRETLGGYAQAYDARYILDHAYSYEPRTGWTCNVDEDTYWAIVEKAEL